MSLVFTDSAKEPPIWSEPPIRSEGIFPMTAVIFLSLFVSMFALGKQLSVASAKLATVSYDTGLADARFCLEWSV